MLIVPIFDFIRTEGREVVACRSKLERDQSGFELKANEKVGALL
jgi:hypothetical protein